MLSTIKKNKGVYYITEKDDKFSSYYLDVRKKEQRIYSDDVVKQLPKVAKNHHYYKEWTLRQNSTKRIINYLTSKNKPLKILDIGCGNGWFSYQLSLIPDSDVYGLDVNDIELEQANRVFQKSNLKFMYADVFSSETEILPLFDIITVNSCIQYFEDFESITKRLKAKLSPNGELHILDSPFYKISEIPNAKERTKAYYTKLGVPAMAENYFHHKLTYLKDFDILFNPSTSILDKILKRKDTPFMWLKFVEKRSE